MNQKFNKSYSDINFLLIIEFIITKLIINVMIINKKIRKIRSRGSNAF